MIVSKKTAVISHKSPGPSAIIGKGKDHSLLRLQSIVGNKAMGRLIQTKLKVSRPHDPDEQEADHVAEQVMRMTKPRNQPRAITSCVDCDGKLARKPDQEGIYLAKDTYDRHAKADIGLEALLQNLPDGGQPLPESLRSFFEPRFGYDLGRVRVHTGMRGDQDSRSVNALAFTVGQNIVFRSDQFAPETNSGKRLLAHELAHTIQQSRSPATVRGAAHIQLSKVAASAANPGRIQRKEGVLKSKVTKKNPLERLLNGEDDGLTTPFVNGTMITDTHTLDDAIPSKMSYAAAGAANSCKVGSPIDIFSQAEIITASDPGPKGWTAKVPFNTVKQVLGVTDDSCETKKTDINVRMVAEGGNAKYAELVRKAEGDHEAVLADNHQKFLKPYHDFVNSQTGTGTSLQDCATKLASGFRDKEVKAIDDWAAAWAASTKKFDSPNGPHTSTASVKVSDNCSEVLVTMKRQAGTK